MQIHTQKISGGEFYAECIKKQCTWCAKWQNSPVKHRQDLIGSSSVRKEVIARIEVYPSTVVLLQLSSQCTKFPHNRNICTSQYNENSMECHSSFLPESNIFTLNIYLP